eukprot:2434193-Rhodomonas_salina.2
MDSRRSKEQSDEDATKERKRQAVKVGRIDTQKRLTCSPSFFWGARVAAPSSFFSALGGIVQWLQQPTESTSVHTSRNPAHLDKSHPTSQPATMAHQLPIP